MGKLIDVDKTIDIIDSEMTMEDSLYNDGLCRAIQIIGNRPTVEAIPIEWIEEYIKILVIKRKFLAENGYRDNRCYDYMFGIIGMLDDWDTEIREEENGSN